MNVYYKLLVFFQRGEMVTRSWLLSKPNITEELIEKCLQLGYIQEVDRTNEGDARYAITEAGRQKRDE